MHARIDGQLFAVAVQGEQLTKTKLLTSRGRLAILGEHVDAFDFTDMHALIPHIRKLFVSHTRCYNWEHLSRAVRLREISAYVTTGVLLNLTAHPELRGCASRLSSASGRRSKSRVRTNQWPKRGTGRGITECGRPPQRPPVYQLFPDRQLLELTSITRRIDDPL